MAYNKRQKLFDNIEALRLSLQEREAGGAMVDQLESMGIKVHTDPVYNRRTLKEARKDQSLEGRVRYFRNQEGQVYGWVHRGEFHLDIARLDAELPLHEYAHLWCESLRRVNPDNWKRVVDLMRRDTESWEFISSVVDDPTDVDMVAEEMIARYSGQKGSERLLEELQRMQQRDDRYKSRWNNIFANVSKAVQDFWRHVGDSFGFRYDSADEVYDAILKDFADRINPLRKVQRWLGERDREYAAAVSKGDLGKASELFNRALDENIGSGITPFVAVDGYRGRMDRLARQVKTGDDTALDEAASLLAPLVPDDAVLVPAPSHVGMATDMLELARRVARVRGGLPVADVLKSEPRMSQYVAKKLHGHALDASELGIYKDGDLPKGKLPVVIDNVVNSGNTAKACIDALGRGILVAISSAVTQGRHVASLKSAAPVVYDRKGNLISLSSRFDLRSRYVGRLLDVVSGNKGNQYTAISGLKGYSETHILELVRDHFVSMLEDSDIDARIVSMKVIGSRTEDDSRSSSDLDVLLEYEGGCSEDALFNILNDGDDALYIEGVRVDINPITEYKSGTLAEYLERNRDYYRIKDDNQNDIIGMEYTISQYDSQADIWKVVFDRNLLKHVDDAECAQIAREWSGFESLDEDMGEYYLTGKGNAEGFASSVADLESVRKESARLAALLPGLLQEVLPQVGQRFDIMRRPDDMTYNPHAFVKAGFVVHDSEGFSITVGGEEYRLKDLTADTGNPLIREVSRMAFVRRIQQSLPSDMRIEGFLRQASFARNMWLGHYDHAIVLSGSYVDDKGRSHGVHDYLSLPAAVLERVSQEVPLRVREQELTSTVKKY
ncbi:MAG: hypothetical protein IK119_09755, partial [Bacteroidales bacterium]|nr:hypothetical protein [Bacteroidales bacterium]